MNKLMEKRTLVIYILLSLVFVLALGVVFTQVARFFVVASFENQVEDHATYVADEIISDDMTLNELQQGMAEYSRSFPVNIFYENSQSEEQVHTFAGAELYILQHLREENVNSRTTYGDSLLYPYQMSSEETIVVVQDMRNLSMVNATIWWIIAGVAVVVIIFLWSFGNRVYENYVHPIQKATDTATRLADGDYEARIYDAPYGIASQLSQAVNRLARNLGSITSKYKNQNDRLKTVVNNMDSGLLLINERGITRLTNESFYKHFTNHTETYIGKPYYEVINHQELNSAIQEVIFTEQKKQTSVTLEDGTYFEVYLAPIRNEEENWKGVVIVCHDITDIKQLENVRKDFVANVSHELRTPITSIQGFAETLLDGNTHDQETVENFLTIIERESRRLNQLIQDLLELSTLEKDHFVLNRSEFSFEQLVQEIRIVLSSKIEEKNINFIINETEAPVLYADRDKVYQMMMNLLSNAIHYSNDEGKVICEYRLENNEGIIEVCDEGIGIPREQQGRIFERFYRVDKGRSRHSGGTGLGLSIVKHIVEAHEGSIELSSEMDEGTTITVRLPQTIQ
ncbi:PAS domain-containing sensor histidine kinase [Halalkalibacillus sediminis]|uniref:histidine kinase n=1 Tax=Halalkalibacillus sediminis TaxID=2018042 RepID=A0A2I0QYP9_9BACI|nr:HAMP domain-containing sensor histidine kinase [Halalkalibacillus sediminis]PKR79260.1 PAS domain-containing sensor histidine kinase [Halalkalibacillus sediminis]